MQKVNLAEKLGQISEHWVPRIVGELNGQHVKLVKLEGEFVWHRHDTEDELFLVLKGRLDIHLRDHVVSLDEQVMPATGGHAGFSQTCASRLSTCASRL